MYVAVLGLNLLQHPGRITFDSKLDLQLSPIDFMTRSLTLWNPAAAFGGLQNQASGFLFPMGSFFGLGSLAGVPVWVWERCWSAVVMLLAYEGARRLATRWGDLNKFAAIAAGLAYMLAPRVLTTVGGLTGETLPTAILPWTVLPLVLYVRGRMGRWTALVASAATLPFMGGQNATEVLATLLLPALVLWFGDLSLRDRLRDLSAWLGLVGITCLWWLVPLLFLGRYSPPFLNFIESARNTTAPIGWLSAFRGTDHWVAFLPGGSTSGWAAGYDLVSSPLLLVTTTAVAAGGLLGLVLGQVPLRRALALSLLVGFFALTAGSGGLAASPLGHVWVDALDTVLAPFRNIHKFDPLVRLPLSLGVGFLVARATRSPVQSAADNRSVLTYRVAAVATALAVLLSAGPAFGGNLRDASGFDDLPQAWERASAYLSGLPSTTRVMVVPGAGFGIQSWGRTVDTPLQVMDPPPWVVRNQTPLSPPQTIRFQDSIEDILVGGRPSNGLARLLSRAGITHLLVRNDLDQTMTDAPDPNVVHNVLDNSPGLSKTRSFGDAANGYPLVEVYRVVSTRGETRARLLRWDRREAVQGGAGAIAPLVTGNLLAPDQPAILKRRLQKHKTADAVTDNELWHERTFGRVHEAVSDVMTAAAPFRLDRARHDYSLDDSPRGLTVARYRGVAQVTASSSTGYADAFGPVKPEEGPYAAIDGSLLTAWASSPLTHARGQWLELNFKKPTALGPLSLQFDTVAGARVQDVRVETDGGVVRASVDRSGGTPGVRLPAAPASFLRLTVTGVRGTGFKQVRLTDLEVSGLQISRALELPGRAEGNTRISFTSTPPTRACFHAPRALICQSGLARSSVELGGFDRSVRLRSAGSWRISGTGMATGGAEVAALFVPLSRRSVTVTGSSFFAGDPAVVPSNAFDGHPLTSWLAAPGDNPPVLDLSWRGKRTINRIRASLVQGQPGRLPSSIRVESDEGVQVVDLSGHGMSIMTPVKTNFLRLTMQSSRTANTTDSIGVSELSIDGLDDLRYAASPTARTGSICGLGPSISTPGQRIETRLVGTFSDLTTGAEVEVHPCGNRELRMERGRTVLHVQNPPGFAVSGLSLVPAVSSTQPRRGRAGSLKVELWSATDRILNVDALSESVLVVPQSFNEGWVATLAGRRLRALTADGWMQAWRVPAGSTGVVRLHYAPQPFFRAGILGGLVAAFLVMALSLVLLIGRRRRGRGRSTIRLPGRSGLGAGSPTRWRQMLRSMPAAVVTGLVSMPLLVGFVLGGAAGRNGRPRTAVVSVSLLGLAMTYAASKVAHDVVAPAMSDVLVAVAVGLVLGNVWGMEQKDGATDGRRENDDVRQMA